MIKHIKISCKRTKGYYTFCSHVDGLMATVNEYTRSGIRVSRSRTQ